MGITIVLVLSMVRPYYNKGFTLLELCISVAILSIMTLLVLPYVDLEKKFDTYLFESSYLLRQSEAMDEMVVKEVASEGCLLPYNMYFNAQGNIYMGGTIHCDKRVITVQLGSGRLVEK